MNRQNSGLGALLIAALGAIALVVPLSLAQSSPPKPYAVSLSPAYPLPAGQHELTEHSAEDLIGDFLDADPGLLPEEGPWSKFDRQWPARGESWPPDRRGYDDRGLYRIEYLIVTLPDPLAPALRAQFDSRLDAIQRAAEADNFIIDRLDFPWPDPMKGTAAKGEAGEGSRSDREPGLILLRNRKERRLLLLFIVGERPTTGIHKRALRSALDQTAWLSRWRSASEQAIDPFLSVIPPVAADSDAPELRLMGPTYSGSADSLAFTLRTWLDSSNLVAKPRITIVSGSATAIEPGQFSAPIDYRMTTIPITATVFAKFVMSAFKAKPDEIALLSEANTAYGRSFGPGTTNPALAVGEGEPGPTKTGPPILYLHFPLHISNLRGAWEGRPAIGRLPSPIKASNLPLSRQPDANTDYIVPPYSPRTSVADELVLSTLLTQIHNEHIGYIGLSASDVEDRIFLAKQLRTYCPNAVLVLFNSDLLYLHSDFNLDLRGTLLLSTYPLYNPEQFWTYPFGGHESRVPFSADNDEGVYNATLALLHDEGAMLEYSPPFASEPKRPVLWLSLVGSDRLWPVSFRGPSRTAAGLFTSHGGDRLPNQLFAVAYPIPLVMLFLLASAGYLLFSLLILKHFTPWPGARLNRAARWVWRHEPLSAEAFFETAFEGHAADSEFRLLALERCLGLLSLALVTAGLYVIVVCFVFLPVGTALAGLPGVAPRVNTLAFALALAVTVLVLGAIAIWALTHAVARSGRGVRGEFLKTLIRSTVPFGVSFLLLGYAFCVGIYTWREPAADEFAHDRIAALLLFFRAANLRDGVSPLAAILLVGSAGLVLLGCSVRRLSLLEQCQIRSGFLSFGTAEKSWRGVGELEARIRERLEGAPIELPGGRLFALSCVIIVGWFLILGSGKSIDGRWFDFLVGFASLGVFAAQSWALVRLVCGWRALRLLLRRLYWHPTRVSYEEFQKHLPGGQRLKLTEPPPTTTALEYSLERARQIIALLVDSSSTGKAPGAADLCQELGADVKEVEDTVWNTLGAMADDDWRTAVRLRYQAERALAHLTRRVAVILEPLWRLGDAPRQPAEFENKLFEQGSLFVVSRVVDLLRQVFPHFQNLAFFVTASILLMLLAVSSYPFGHRDTLLWIAWLAVGSAVGAMLYVFVSMNRDRVLSLLQGTTPGQLTWNSTFVTQVVIYGLLPVLGLLGAQFPGQLNQAFSWVSSLAGKS
jgi:hypothetical protein